MQLFTQVHPSQYLCAESRKPLANMRVCNRQIHKIRQVPIAHHGAADSGRARALQDLDQAQRRDALPVRRQRRQGPRGPLVRRLPQPPGHRRLQHVRHAARLRRHRPQHRRGEEAGSDWYSVLPTGGLRRISERRRYVVRWLKRKEKVGNLVCYRLGYRLKKCQERSWAFTTKRGKIPEFGMCIGGVLRSSTYGRYFINMASVLPMRI